jgi:hypothetical protein
MRDARREGECLVAAAGHPDRSGHRRLWAHGRLVGVHRLAWQEANGREVPPGLLVRHSCDNPPCIEPSHLLLGTVADNNRDRDERGRHRALRGSENGRAKLTEAQANEIRLSGASGPVLAARYGISRSTVSLIRKGRRYQHRPNAVGVTLGPMLRLDSQEGTPS